jgi:hypothetical protein
VIRAALLVLVIVLTGCSSQDTSPTRSSLPPPSDAGVAEDADAAAQPDPNGGRDDKVASCYAACQNGAFTCQAKSASGVVVTTVEMTPEKIGGCSGTLTAGTQSVAMKLDCLAGKVCTGDAPDQPANTCVAATFSAFSFAYVPAGAVQNVCTRD